METLTYEAKVSPRWTTPKLWGSTSVPLKPLAPSAANRSSRRSKASDDGRGSESTGTHVPSRSSGANLRGLSISSVGRGRRMTRNCNADAPVGRDAAIAGNARGTRPQLPRARASTSVGSQTSAPDECDELSSER